MNRINELSEKIIKARNDYYAGNPELSDAAFDALIDELKELDPNNVAVTSIGAPVVASEWEKVKHKIPMGSLDKVNTPEEVKKWIKDRCGDKAVFLTEKLDGLSIELVYDNGKLIQAITRGDGEIGENVTANVIKMRGAQKDLGLSFTGSLRGEIIMRRSIHKKYFSDKANPRNAAVGVTKRLDGQGSEHLDVMHYQIIGDFGDLSINLDTEQKVFDQLNVMKCQTPNRAVFDKNSASANADEIIKIWQTYQIEGQLNVNGTDLDNKNRDSLDYDIDGLVIRLNNIAEQEALGEKDLRPKGAVAFKFANQMRETILRDVIWQIGDGGRITPIAVFDPIIISGALLEKASLHNVKYFNSLKLFKNCRVLVSRRNDIIPYVEENLGE